MRFSTADLSSVTEFVTAANASYFQNAYTNKYGARGSVVG
jgi:hypothetical protein